MIHWTRAVRDCLCGNCGKQLAPNDPLQVMTITGVSRRMYRCQECADGSIPANLPALQAKGKPDAVREREPTLVGILAKRYDVRMRQVGEEG